MNSYEYMEKIPCIFYNLLLFINKVAIIVYVVFFTLYIP